MKRKKKKSPHSHTEREKERKVNFQLLFSGVSLFFRMFRFELFICVCVRARLCVCIMWIWIIYSNSWYYFRLGVYFYISNRLAVIICTHSFCFFFCFMWMCEYYWYVCVWVSLYVWCNNNELVNMFEFFTMLSFNWHPLSFSFSLSLRFGGFCRSVSRSLVPCFVGFWLIWYARLLVILLEELHLNCFSPHIIFFGQRKMCFFILNFPSPPPRPHHSLLFSFFVYVCVCFFQIKFYFICIERIMVVFSFIFIVNLYLCKTFFAILNWKKVSKQAHNKCNSCEMQFISNVLVVVVRALCFCLAGEHNTKCFPWQA